MKTVLHLVLMIMAIQRGIAGYPKGDTVEVLTYRDPQGRVVDSDNEQRIRELYARSIYSFFNTPWGNDSFAIYANTRVPNDKKTLDFFFSMSGYITNMNFTDGKEPYLENMINPDSVRNGFHSFDKCKWLFTKNIYDRRDPEYGKPDYDSWKRCHDLATNDPFYRDIYEHMLYYLSVWKSYQLFAEYTYDRAVVLKDRVYFIRYMSDRNKAEKTDKYLIKKFYVWR